MEAAEALDAALSATSSSPLEPPGAGAGSGAALMTSEQLQAQARPPNLACMHPLVAGTGFFFFCIWYNALVGGLAQRLPPLPANLDAARN